MQTKITGCAKLSGKFDAAAFSPLFNLRGQARKEEEMVRSAIPPKGGIPPSIRGRQRRQQNRDSLNPSTAKPFRVYGGRRKAEEKPLPPYLMNSWEGEGEFVVHIEEVATPHWADHRHGISISGQGDVLRVVDTRKGAPKAAVFELLIPEKYNPDLEEAIKIYRENLRIVEIRFKERG